MVVLLLGKVPSQVQRGRKPQIRRGLGLSPRCSRTLKVSQCANDT